MEICVNRVRDSASFTTKTEARAWAEQREEEIRSGRSPEDASRTLQDVFRRYAREVSPKKRGARWERLRLAAFEREPFAQIPLARLSKAHIAEWRDRRLEIVSPGSVIREMNLLASALEAACREWEWLRSNPAREVRKPPQPRARSRRPTQDEIERICLALGWDEGGAITSVSQRVAAAWLFAIETAMRAGEICGLLPEHVDLERRFAHLPLTKNGLARDVPLSSRAVELLEQLQPWGETVFQLSTKSLDALFRKARVRCGIEDLHFHDSRREATSRMAKLLHPLELARVTGHKNLSMLLTYYNETAEEIARKLG